MTHVPVFDRQSREQQSDCERENRFERDQRQQHHDARMNGDTIRHHQDGKQRECEHEKRDQSVPREKSFHIFVRRRPIYG